MKTTVSALLFLSLLSTSCDRVSMEGSPEALVSYGVPSQHSNTQGDQAAAKKKETSESWMGSSAINPKPRAD